MRAGPSGHGHDRAKVKVRRGARTQHLRAVHRRRTIRGRAMASGAGGTAFAPSVGTDMPASSSSSSSSSAVSGGGGGCGGGAAAAAAAAPRVSEKEPIDVFTLMFVRRELEIAWMRTNRERVRRVSRRYLLAASLFQAVYLAGDLVDFGWDMEALPRAVLFVRMGLAALCIACCVSISAGLLQPSQMFLFFVNAVYGVPTLALHYLPQRKEFSLWGSLFLVYGLIFFTLPKISPLDFIHGFWGSFLFVSLYLVVSAARLATAIEWVLSAFLIAIASVMFGYISYSSERAARERWLLRQRLLREHIDLKLKGMNNLNNLVGDDLESQSQQQQHQPLPQQTQSGDSSLVMLTESSKRATDTVRNSTAAACKRRSDAGLLGHMTAAAVMVAREGSESGGDEPVEDSDSLLSVSAGERRESEQHREERQRLEHDQKPQPEQQNNSARSRRRQLMVKGIFAWLLFTVLGGLCDLINVPDSFRDVSPSVAFAIVVHLAAFSIFLLVVTQQIRWVAVNVVLGFVILWIVAKVVPKSRSVVGPHIIGYIVLGVAVTAVVCVFGGVVLVWSELVNFLKSLLVRYPQVQEELRSSSSRVLEQVLVRHMLRQEDGEAIPDLTDLPVLYSSTPVPFTASTTQSDGTTATTGPTSATAATHQTTAAAATGQQLANQSPVFHPGGAAAAGFPMASTSPSAARLPAGSPHHTRISVNATTAYSSSHSNNTDNSNELVSMLQSKSGKGNCCYFCRTKAVALLVPACEGWKQDGAQQRDSSLPMCTPYASLAHSVRQLEEQLRETQALLHQARAKHAAAENRSSAADVERCRLAQQVDTLTAQLGRNDREAVQRERAAREDQVAALTQQLNDRSGELKRVNREHRALQRRARDTERELQRLQQKHLRQAAVSHPPPVLPQTEQELPAMEPEQQVDGSDGCEEHAASLQEASPKGELVQGEAGDAVSPTPHPSSAMEEDAMLQMMLSTPLDAVQDMARDAIVPTLASSASPAHVEASGTSTGGTGKLKVVPATSRPAYAAQLEADGIREDLRRRDRERRSEMTRR